MPRAARSRGARRRPSSCPRRSALPAAPAWKRERTAIAYTPDVKAKGLDVVCGAWAAADVDDATLQVFGVEREQALAHLNRTHTPIAGNVEFRGKTPPEEFRAAVRRGRVYVGGARWEDYGVAPLEALADGALLVTVPSGGPFEALALARELAPELVTGTVGAEPLAAALRAAFAMPEDRLRDLSRPRRDAARAASAGGDRPNRRRAGRTCAAGLTAPRRGVQHGSLEGLYVGLERVALGHGQAARREPLAQGGLAHQPLQGGGDRGRRRSGPRAARSRRRPPRRRPRRRGSSRSAAARRRPPPVPSRRTARRC